MKQVSIVFTFVLCLGLFSQANAQFKMPSANDLNKAAGMLSTVPDEAFTSDILKALTPDKSLGLSADQALKLTNNNKSYVDDVLGVVAGKGSETDKFDLVSKLTGQRQDFVGKLLGKSKAGKYYELVKKQVQPLVAKYALAKVFMK